MVFCHDSSLTWFVFKYFLYFSFKEVWGTE